MSPLKSEMLEPAKNLDLEAIAHLINQRLVQASPECEFLTKATLKGTCLYLRIEAVKAPELKGAIATVQSVLVDLALTDIRQARIYGWVKGEDFPAWQEELKLPKTFSSAHHTWLDAVRNSLPKLPHLGKTHASQPATPSTGREAEDAATAQLELAQEAQTTSWWDSVTGVVSGAVGTVGELANHSGKAITTSVSGAAEAVGHAAQQTGKVVSGTVTGAAGAVGQAAQQTGKVLANTTHGAMSAVGYATDTVGEVVDQMDWLVPVLDRVDIVKAEESVRRLQAKHPNEPPRAIAHRIMMQKALLVSGTGAASSFIPGMVALDLAATTVLQAEMGYQIAGAYGLDLRDPARKGEILAIFGLALGGSYALRAGLGMMRLVPVAGAVVGASTNAVALYTVGHVACQFYEARAEDTAPKTLVDAAQQERDAYLQEAIAQQIAMDQILAHMVRASAPNLTWQETLPELQRLNFSPVSLKVITDNHSHPTPLETLLVEINQDFAVPLLAQCRQIAEADGIVTEEESKVLDQITQTLVQDKDVENTTESAKESVQTVKRGLFNFWKRSGKPS
ncbi:MULTISPECIES: hypothetical protein [unclassified Leptolyngbya]|uniref:hypothetical protein n=1 Tax=unclassified Leptolyngbya TaxID=2650499 RepID=UPI001685ED78|nr:MULTISPECIES: hypothetical protein [unclassified Leptolyngbya]MBD1909292.1 hypothetical protein [Leptolyngbya sp. FACHB-8]MBD2153522.1 hypothetical protein [Leptolyngbya sp. FACHB-16]